MRLNEEILTRLVGLVTGCLLLLGGLYVAVFPNEDPKRSHRDSFHVVSAFGLFWTGILLLRKSIPLLSKPEYVKPALVHPKKPQVSSPASLLKLRRGASSSTCPKPCTPSAPIRVVNVCMNEKKSRKPSKPSRPVSRGSGPRVPTSDLLIAKQISPVSDASSIINYNNESLVSSHECNTTAAPDETPVSGLGSPLSAFTRMEVPDSIAAIWEPVAGPSDPTGTPASLGNNMW